MGNPRRRAILWSRVNRQRVERLEQAGRLLERGRPDPDLTAALDAGPAARALFGDLDSTNRFDILFRVHQAKTPEKRAAKVAEMVAMLARGETIHARRVKRGLMGES